MGKVQLTNDGQKKEKHQTTMGISKKSVKPLKKVSTRNAITLTYFFV